MADKPKLLPNFDPIWPEDFELLHLISKSAFILWRLLISYRDINTSICTLSDSEIQRITKFNRQTARNARKELSGIGLIVHQGYHTCLVRNSKRLDSWTKTVQPSKSKLDGNHPTSWTKTIHHLDENHPIVGQKSSNPIYRPDTDLTDKGNFNNLGNEKAILNTVGKELKK